MQQPVRVSLVWRYISFDPIAIKSVVLANRSRLDSTYAGELADSRNYFDYRTF